MKHFIYLIFVCLLQLAFQANADETNRYDTFVYGTSPAKLSNAGKGDGGEQSRESLPAKDFPEGNWGQPCEGFQLSLRFDKQIYKEGEPITAILLARNVTNHEIGFVELIKTGGNGPVGFVITNASGQQLISEWEKRNFSAGHMVMITPQTQRQFYERLDKIYDLKRGTYSVQAAIKIPKNQPAGGFTEIRSAEVPVKIKNWIW